MTHVYNKGQWPGEKLNKITYSVSGDMKFDKFTAEAGITYNKRFYPNQGGTGYGGSGYLYNLLVWSGADIYTEKTEWTEPVCTLGGYGAGKGYYAYGRKGGYSMNNDVLLMADHKFGDFALDGFVGEQFIPRILEALQKRGSVYYGKHSSLDVGILSKYKIESQEEVRDAGSILRATFCIGKHTIAAYSAHLDYKNYACYLPRGYNGATWKKMDAPVNDANR